ncbi:hypothetical protein HS1genome_0772 [Sulfodiicoccus acidiphilus]|uniref:Uncharacterized protein n=1 Tax=Sulfodiicoccus acidiphilus TaxID=1670455 RepID=A0A348B2I1_9CREN|nr:hypothetical protein HS1genome_0772 [Sulfodiicoccus acidiphilus]GGT97497.1 hypothetical protein GCM10007116_13830 [Sulfodiicoccus acidiphilus]
MAILDSSILSHILFLITSFLSTIDPFLSNLLSSVRSEGSSPYKYYQKQAKGHELDLLHMWRGERGRQPRLHLLRGKQGGGYKEPSQTILAPTK